MREVLSCALSCLLLGGCYLFHRSPSDDALPVDAPDASLEAGIDAAGEDTVDAGLECDVQSLAAGEMFLPVDMVWVVDSSSSMANELERIEKTMNQFVADAEARHFDVRLTMVTQMNVVPPPLGLDDMRYRFVQRSVGSREPLEALLDEFPRYGDFLRPEAALHFVVVSDDDSAITASEFKRQMDRRLRREYTVHAVASPDVGGQPCRTQNASEQCLSARTRRAGAECGASAIGREYYELAEQSGGEEISICLDDWGEVFGPLLDAVTPVAIPCEIDLPLDAALDDTTVELRVGQSVEQLPLVAGPAACERSPTAFYYADLMSGPQLTLCPAACEATRGEGARLDIKSRCTPRPTEGPL